MDMKAVEYKTKIIGGHDVFHIGICDDEPMILSETQKILSTYMNTTPDNTIFCFSTDCNS